MSDNKLRLYSAEEGHFLHLRLGALDLRPPYQLRKMNMIYVVGHWPEGADLPALPEGLSPSASRTGVIGLYSADEAHELAPGQLLFVGIAVQETHAPDGTPAAYLFHGEVDGAAATLLPRYINENYIPARVTLTVRPDEMRGEVLVGDGTGRFAIALRPDPATEQIGSGTNYYIGTLDDAVAGFSVAFSNTTQLSEVTDFSLDLPEGHPLAVLRPFVFDYALAIRDMSMTYGVPFPLDLATPTRGSTLAGHHERDALVTGVLDVFARIGRPIAIVDDLGRILYSNSGAEALLGRLRRDGPPRIAPHGRASWQDAPVSPQGIRLTLPLADGTVAVARVMPISLRLSDRPAMMVLMDDPAEAGPFDPVALLRLFGLTKSEARLAAQIGRGLSPAEAASVLGITRETARTSLKMIFGKLGIGRQADLARLVTRLEMV